MMQRKIIPDSNLKLFFSYFKPHKKIFFADMICALFISLVDLYFPVISRYTINTVVPQYKNAPEQTLQTFLIIIIACIFAFILRTAANFFVTYFGHMFGVSVETDMRRDIFEHIEAQSFSYFDSHRTGKIMSRVTNDLFEVSELAHHGPEDAFISILTLIGSFFIMLQVKWQLAVIIFTMLPILISIMIFSRKAMLAASKKVKETTSIINSELESSISGVRVTKVFTNEDYENERFAKSNQLYFSAKALYYKAMANFGSRNGFVTNIISVVVLAVGGYYIMKGEMNLGDYIAANLFVAAFLQPIRRLQNLVEEFSIGMAGFTRFTEIMHSNDYTEEKEDAIDLEKAKGDIVYDNVSFAYNEGKNVLSNLNLKVKSGETLALVGPSGSGKSTICNLLPRFYEVSKGKITIDGYDIQGLTLSSLRKKIGMVQQDVFLFAGSIKENIAYGKIGASDEEIIEAAKRAEIYDDIMAMPQAFDTIVGERGIKLSGGQKQRVSIARIFLKNPPILILDEATSALDSATEIKIQHSFEELAKGRTTFIIAHRLSTIKNADAIAVVNNEGISEIGSHEELMAKGGIYKKLYTAQFGNQ